MGAKHEAHWYSRYYRDYAQDTSHLSMLEHGAYTLLLDCYYLQGKPLTDNRVALARQIRALLPEEMEAMDAVLAQFFERTDDGWRNKRADEELAKRTELIGKRRTAGSQGGRAKASRAGWQDQLAKPAEGVDQHVLQQMAEQLAEQMLEQSRSTSSGTEGSNSSTHTHTHTHTHTQNTEHTAQPKKQPPTQKPVAPPAAPAAATAGSMVWDAYREAYLFRYSVEPTRNAKANALCKQLVDRLGEDAPSVAAFFVGHNKRFYVEAVHPLNLLVQDAEALRTQYLTNTRITSTQARQADKTQATANVFLSLMNEKESSHG